MKNRRPDYIDVDSDSENEEVAPRDAVRTAVEHLIDEHHIVRTREQTKRKEKLDQADRKVNEAAKLNAVVVNQAGEVKAVKPVESSQGEEVEQGEGEEEEKQVEVKQKFEVVIVGTLRFMPPFEIAEEVEADSARRIFRRVNGTMEPTTAVVLTFYEEPPSIVYIDHERFKTRPYVRQAVRCHNCQGFNHRQAGCRNSPRCSRCGRRHSTGACNLDTDQPLRCANCRGDHSAASPECPAFLNVKKAWKIVAMDKISYANAIKSVSQPDSTDATRSRSDENRARGRADLIEAPAQLSRHSKWATKVCLKETKPTMCTMETQTEPEPSSVQTQTTKEVDTQTAPEPKEKAI